MFQTLIQALNAYLYALAKLRREHLYALATREHRRAVVIVDNVNANRYPLNPRKI